jgi:ubiquinone/menaquinone biosynthesis C-methylase UbiE
VSADDHVATAQAVYNMAAPRYVQFVGTEISTATEGPIDRAVLVAFVELINGRTVGRVADVGCGPGRVAALMTEHGLDVIGLDVSQAMLAVARTAHPHINFVEGQLDALPIETGGLTGAVCWYSIIYTPSDRLAEAFGELARVLMMGGYLLLAFQAGSGESVHRAQAQGTNLPLTSYRHSVQEVAGRLEEVGLKIYTTVLRAPELEHETTSQGFIIASRALPQSPGHGSPDRQ